MRSPDHIRCEEQARGLEAGGFAQSATVGWRLVGGLELMADSPCGSPRRDVIYSVRVGSPRIDQTAQTTSDVPVRQVIVNSRFRARRYWSWVGQANNIGLLHLERALQYSEYVRPICLPGLDYVLKDRSRCTVMGWGLPRVNGAWEAPQSRPGGVGQGLGTRGGVPRTDGSEPLSPEPLPGPSCQALLSKVVFPLRAAACLGNGWDGRKSSVPQELRIGTETVAGCGAWAVSGEEEDFGGRGGRKGGSWTREGPGRPWG